jgi:hypothetical protein
MTVVVLAALAGLVLLAAHGRPLITLSVLTATVLLVPATMVLPGSPVAALTGSRLVELACVVGALRAPRRQGGVRVPLTLLPLVVYAGVALVTGVAFASTQVDPVSATYAWFGTGEMVLVVLLALSLARRLPASQLLVVLAVAGVVTALVGLGEWLTRESWARYVLRAAQPGVGGVPAQPLEHRSGDVRVRGATEFALAYGWLMAALVPVVVAATLVKARIGVVMRVLVVAGVPAVLAAVFLSRGRSPLLAALVLLAAVLALLVPRRPAFLLLLGVLVLGSAVWLGPDVVHRLSPSVDQGSVDIRVHRLPHVLDLAAANPFRGTGLTGIQVFGTGFVDSSYLQVYVESGVLAVVLFVIALVAPLVSVLRGVLLGRGGDDWLLAMATFGGMSALVVGAAFFDAFTTLSSTRLFWLLVGVALVAAERCIDPVERPGWRQVLQPARLALVLAAIGVGLVARALWPGHATATALIQTVDTKTAMLSQPAGLSRTLDTTVCQAAREGIDPAYAWHVSTCEELATPGWVRVAVTAHDRPAASTGLTQLTTSLKAYPGLAGIQQSTGTRGAVFGIPTVARTAPVTLGIAVGALVLLLPGRRRPAVR